VQLLYIKDAKTFRLETQLGNEEKVTNVCEQKRKKNVSEYSAYSINKDHTFIQGIFYFFSG
jgi:hypothetical protein